MKITDKVDFGIMILKDGKIVPISVAQINDNTKVFKKLSSDKFANKGIKFDRLA